MNYQQALDFILGTPNIGEVEGRSVMEALMNELGNPQKTLKFVHIAGTNGKGSTAAFTASILRSAGYKTGLYTSPFIQRFNERIQVNGEQIPDDALAEITGNIAEAADRVQNTGLRRPTIFELITALGFCWFAQCSCDIVVLEVGLGGRLDATNCIDSAEAYVMVNIGYDHTELLGDTLPKIAAEKAGIIKPYGKVIAYAQSDEAEQVFKNTCIERKCDYIRSDSSLAVVKHYGIDGTVFDFGRREDLKITLLGRYQVRNACTAITVSDVLRSDGWNISEQALRDGLVSAHWPGRLELLRREPIVFIDGAHNPQGTAALMESMDELFPGKKLNFVAGVLADKDYDSSIAIAAPHAKKFFAATPPSYRALSSSTLAEKIRLSCDAPAAAYDNIIQAIEAAIAESGSDDVICIFGSLYQVGEIRNYFGRKSF